MPTCNLAETIHNKWLQQFGNKMSCLYEATVDDMIRAFVHIANYWSWLKGGSSGKGPDQPSLKLKAAAHIGDPKLLAEAMRSYHGAKGLNTRDCALEGSELFGSTNRKLDLPPGSECDFHRPDKVNYSIPHPNTRSKRARIEESFKHDENVVFHTTNVLESNCSESEWHISRLPYPSNKECQALQANIEHPCRAKVGKNTHGTPAPTYTGMKKEYRSNNHVPTNFGFVQMTLIDVWSGARRNGCLIGQISLRSGRWRLVQNLHGRRCLHWKMLGFNCNRKRHCHHVVDWEQWRTSPSLIHISVFLQTQMCIQIHGFPRQFDKTWQHHYQSTWISGRTRYIWIVTMWLVWLPFHTLNTDAS